MASCDAKIVHIPRDKSKWLPILEKLVPLRVNFKTSPKGTLFPFFRFPCCACKYCCQ